MLIGRKIGMTQVFGDDGVAIAVTAVQLGPCVVTQKKDADRNGGVNAIQIGFDPLKEKNAKKPQLESAKKAGLKSAFRVLKDMRVDKLDDYEVGQEFNVTQFEIGQFVDVIAKTKGRGFQGVIKRHGHHGGPGGHGSMFHRSTGGIGQSASPGRVFKGRKMPGQMGAKRITAQNLKVIAVYPEDNLVLLKGAVPGAAKGIITVCKAKKKS